jgi:hypothetical protein
MWVKMIFGFDKDGLLIPKWRDAFQLHGAFVGELSLQDEDVPQLRRRAAVARLTIRGKDVTPPLIDAVLRYAKDQALTVSGIAEHEPWNRWKAQAWRMELTTPPPVDVQASQVPQPAVTETQENEKCHESMK